MARPDPAEGPPDDPTVAAAKRALRAHVRSTRASLPASVRAVASRGIAERLADAVRAAGARTVGLYAATAEEVDLDPLAARLLGGGCQVALPLVSGPAELSFHLVAAMPTAVGSFGIREPDPAAPQAASLDLVVVPGLAFDPRGGRIGYGRGFYDRWLAAQRPRPRAVGACFGVQVVDEVPRGPFDVDLDAVVTEGAVYS